MQLLLSLWHFIRSLLAKRAEPDAHQEEPEPLLWKPEKITAEIRADNVYLKVGKYLHLEQRLDHSEHGWTISKVEIPDTWIVLEVAFKGEHLVLRVKDRGEFQINASNLGPLGYAVLCAGKGKKAADEKLEAIWNEHAKAQAHG